VARKRQEHAHECDERLTRVFALLGKRWSGVILGLLLQGPARFAVLARTIPGISERMLSGRLNELTEAGLIDRRYWTGPRQAGRVGGTLHGSCFQAGRDEAASLGPR